MALFQCYGCSYPNTAAPPCFWSTINDHQKVLRWNLMFCSLSLQINLMSADMKSISTAQTLFCSTNTNRKAPTNAAKTQSSWLKTILSSIPIHCVKNNLMFCFITGNWKTSWQPKDRSETRALVFKGHSCCRGSREDFSFPPHNFNKSRFPNDIPRKYLLEDFSPAHPLTAQPPQSWTNCKCQPN